MMLKKLEMDLNVVSVLINLMMLSLEIFLTYNMIERKRTLEEVQKEEIEKEKELERAKEKELQEAKELSENSPSL